MARLVQATTRRCWTRHERVIAERNPRTKLWEATAKDGPEYFERSHPKRRAAIHFACEAVYHDYIRRSSDGES